MPYLRTYHIIVSHAWSYGDQYERLINLLRGTPLFRFKDYSVPKGDPIHSRSTSVIRNAIRHQIQQTHVMLALGGVYATHSDWIQEELQMAVELDKPIVALKPWGNQKMSAVVQDYAAEVVNWNTVSIIDAIRRNAN